MSFREWMQSFALVAAAGPSFWPTVLTNEFFDKKQLYCTILCFGCEHTAAKINMEGINMEEETLHPHQVKFAMIQPRYYRNRGIFQFGFPVSFTSANWNP